MLKSASPQQVSPSSGTSDDVIHLSQDQESVLEAQFSRNRIPRVSDLELLAAELGMEEQDVQAWYSYRMAAWRKEQGLPSNI